MVGNVVRLALNRHLYYPANRGSVSTYINIKSTRWIWSISLTWLSATRPLFLILLILHAESEH